MASYHGKSGVIKLGANVVAETTGFSITETAKTVDDTVQGDAWDTHLVGTSAWSGSINANYYPADTNGQAVLLVGASVAIEFDAIGNTSGLEKLTGTCSVTSRQVSSEKQGVVSLTLQVTGNGALVHGSIL